MCDHTSENPADFSEFLPYFNVAMAGSRENSPKRVDPLPKKEVRFTADPATWRYLGWLSDNTLLGETENDVARHLLTQKLTELRQENYRDQEIVEERVTTTKRARDR